VWISTASKEYLAKLAYMTCFVGLVLWPRHASLWRCKAPLKFKVFAWKVVRNMCWTGERRLRHGLTNNGICVFVLQDFKTMTVSNIEGRRCVSRRV
jgi:hypothetical protein